MNWLFPYPAVTGTQPPLELQNHNSIPKINPGSFTVFLAILQKQWNVDKTTLNSNKCSGIT